MVQVLPPLLLLLCRRRRRSRSFLFKMIGQGGRKDGVGYLKIQADGCGFISVVSAYDLWGCAFVCTLKWPLEPDPAGSYGKGFVSYKV